MSRYIFFWLVLLISISAGETIYPCGLKKNLTRTYGIIELRVDCTLDDDLKLVHEIRGNKSHGTQLALYKKDDKLRDSTFYLNGKEEGVSKAWDTLGNVSALRNFKGGKLVGRQEGHWGPNRPKYISTYNASGQENGPQSEWWENGNKKSEIIAKDGQIISGTEYYPNGHPRVTYVTKPNSKRGVFTTQYISASSWAPDGRPTGNVMKGNGDFMLWAAEPETPFVVHQEFYKDSNLVTVKELDSAAVEAWFKANSGKK